MESIFGLTGCLAAGERRWTGEQVKGKSREKKGMVSRRYKTAKRIGYSLPAVVMRLK